MTAISRGLRFAIGFGVMGVFAMPASAAPPARAVALVEDMVGEIAGVRVMDYVNDGQVVKLEPGQSLTLSYLESCTLEAITGGTVTVGERSSTVEGGAVERSVLPCDGGKLLLSAQQSGKAGVTVMRGAPMKLPGAPLPKEQFTIYKTSAVIVVPKPGRVVFERLDAEEPPIEIEIPGHAFDFAKSSNRLVPGGLYRVKAGSASYVVRVDKAARDEGGPAIGRLIRF